MTGFPQKSAPCSGCSRRASGSPRLAELAVRSRHPETPFANQAIESQRERGSAPRSDASFVPGKSFRPVKEPPSNPPVMRAFPPSRIVLLSRHAPCVDNGRRALRSRRSHYRQEIFMNKDRGQQKNAQGSQQGNQKRKDELKRQDHQKGMHGDQKNDKQDEDLGRPVKVGQGDQRSEDNHEDQGGKSKEEEESGRSRQSEPRR